jgi:murein DD-endopeptidase MepM/ murein hydrolase activator NlpD
MLSFEDYFNSKDVKVSPVVDFDRTLNTLYPFNLTESNLELTDELLSDISLFSNWVDKKLSETNSRYGIGGYNELRSLYKRSSHFNTADEPRRLHLGVDIWGPAGTLIYAPLDATIHSYRNNSDFGDYGATIILQHTAPETFYTLYGHLSIKSIQNISKGQTILQGETLAEFGTNSENGNWPPHLHYQLIKDIKDYEGDYPGVCKYSERETYLHNCPDPQLILQHTF